MTVPSKLSDVDVKISTLMEKRKKEKFNGSLS